LIGIWPDGIYNWGTSEAERSRGYPCDSLLPESDEQYFRAVDVEAPAATVFLWLCQLRLAPYSYDWIDNLGRRSPQRLVPDLDRLEPGQTFMRIFKLDSFEAGRSITLKSNWPGVVETAVTYLAEDHGPGASRLLVKFRVVYRGRILALPLRFGLAPGDLIMMRKQLLELKRLAEAS